MFEVWAGAVEKARPSAPENVEVFRVGTAYASARALPEGSVLTVNATATLGNVLKFACANPPDIALEDELEVAYSTVDVAKRRRNSTAPSNSTKTAGPTSVLLRTKCRAKWTRVRCVGPLKRNRSGAKPSAFCLYSLLNADCLSQAERLQRA